MERRQNELRTRMSTADLVDNPCDTERQIEMLSIDDTGNTNGDGDGGEDDSDDSGWTKIRDTATGNIYLYNEKTGETKWEEDDTSTIIDEPISEHTQSNPDPSVMHM